MFFQGLKRKDASERTFKRFVESNCRLYSRVYFCSYIRRFIFHLLKWNFNWDSDKGTWTNHVLQNFGQFWLPVPYVDTSLQLNRCYKSIQQPLPLICPRGLFVVPNQIYKRGTTIVMLFYSVLNSLVALTPLLASRSRGGAVWLILWLELPWSCAITLAFL